ncbi:MAG: 50S ribosomal protein L29 [Proteobacteria bacterium]|nr:50S ribosomal protein L29 [Pseudomonadota bacterium]
MKPEKTMTNRSLAEIRADKQDSVQASLAELRTLELARLQAQRLAEEEKRQEEQKRAANAERQRLEEKERAEERRLTAEYRRQQEQWQAQQDHELALERVRAEAEARVAEKRLELEIKQADAELLKAQVAMPPPRQPWPLFALVVVMIAAQGAFLWNQQRSGDSERSQLSAEIDQLRQATFNLRSSKNELAETLRQARTELSSLRAQLATVESNAKKPVRPAQKTIARRTPHTRPATRNVRRAPILLDKKCTDDPLCWAEPTELATATPE